MPDTDPYTGIRVPLGNEADVVPADLARMREDTRPLLVLRATDEADLGSKFDDTDDDNQLVVSTAARKLWLRYKTGTEYLHDTIYDSRQIWRGMWVASEDTGQTSGQYIAPTWDHYTNNLGVSFTGKSVVVPIEGLYDLRCSFGWRNVSSESTNRQAIIMVNPGDNDTSGGDLPSGFRHAEAAQPSSPQTVYNLTTVACAGPPVRLSEGSRVFFATRQNSGDTIQLVANDSVTWASIARLA